MKKVSLFVPGRLCLFGEHSDWAGTYTARNADLVEGRAIVTGINLGIYATASKSENFEISSFNASGKKESITCEMKSKMLKKLAAESGLFSYCCGVAAYMCENYHVAGVSIRINKVTLPMKKGLSSSAAVCCLVAKAFNELYGLNISTRGIMQIAYRGELLTGSRCGRLDQACAYGETPVLMHFNENEIDVEKLRVGKNFYWVIADLCASKDTKKILAYLNKAYPFATDKTGMQEQEALGKENHVIIDRARHAIEEGNPEELGKIMVEAQNLFDEKVAPACPDELASPVLHSVLNDPKLQPWIYGAKGVGSQGDGTVQLLAKNKETQQMIVDYLNQERHMDAFPFKLNAGGKIKKAIIPIAGIGTRMFPETFFIKKAFLPVIDESGITKPVLMYMLEELIAAEVEDIYLIVGEGEEEAYRKIFDFEFDKEFQSKLPEHLRSYYQTLYETGQRVRYVVQHEKRGFGHAVYQARKYLKKEPAILMLGDFIYRSNLSISCTQQTINAYNKSGGKSVVSIKKVPFQDSKNYGIIHGRFTTERPYLMVVDNMVEKPDEPYAREKLSVDGECFATFGQYVLTDEIFQYLENQIEEQDKMINSNQQVNEIDITSALLHEAQNGDLIAVDVDGESFDVGLPEMYEKTFLEYGKCK
ncbi:MAG: sugar phosphate nucleotidyltransferase [Lachnospiraceae bacterium]|nr:sugar phosphate nucleotidyltransferase [Lachnospiraceae bacterium]